MRGTEISVVLLIIFLVGVILSAASYSTRERMTRQQVIDAVKQCHDGDMGAGVLRDWNSYIVEVQCIPRTQQEKLQ